MERVLGRRIGLAEVARVFVAHFAGTFGRRLSAPERELSESFAARS